MIYEIMRQIRIAHKTTQSAEGLPRLAWSLDEFDRLSELGFFGGVDRERERLELIEGELLPMSAKGARHEWVRVTLQKHLQLRLGMDFDVFGEPDWRPGGDVYLEPEIMISKAGFQPGNVPPAQVLLLIEVADSSLACDQGLKAKIYARRALREYWAVNATTLETRVHRKPEARNYSNAADHAKQAALEPELLPGSSLTLASLGID